MKSHTIKFANWLTKLDNWSNILTVSLATALFVIALVLLLSLRRRKFSLFRTSLAKASIAKNSVTSQTIQNHLWLVNDLFAKPTYCNVCETVMVQGVSCTYCNLYSDEKCLKKAQKMFKCKQISECAASGQLNRNCAPESENRKTWNHHWIKGNLKLNSVCFFCNEDAGLGPNLNDFKCAWCQRCAHEQCLNSVSSSAHDECDFGPIKRLILRPNLIELINTQSTDVTLDNIRIKPALIDNASINFDQYTPIFVFANPKSGSNDADLIVSHLATVLNPLQIIEINKKNLDMVLKWIETYSDQIQFKLLVCGGDGTVGWLLESISNSKFKKYEPAVSILPLGTGNDLSRALKWGQSYLGDVEIEDVLNEIDGARLVKLDRWKIDIENRPMHINSCQTKFMNSYLSIGCDALVTLNFHRERTQKSFSSRLINKLIYLKYGTIDTFLKECRNLTEHIELELDGKKVELPHLESIVLLNIAYWGGGVQPWKLIRTKSRRSSGENGALQPSFSDGLLEVFGIYSSFHIAQMQVGLAEPYRIGQAKLVQIRLEKRFPIQIDGEPWEQKAAVINISRYNQAVMLEKNE